MKTKRIIISFFLLLTYSIGFAHQLIPHHQSSSDKHFCQTEIEESECLKEIHDTELDCFRHTDHCDEGIYNLLVCLFNDKNHPEDDCQSDLYTSFAVTINDLNNSSKLKITGFLQNCCDKHCSVCEKDYLEIIDYVVNSALPFGPQPLRGPPTIS